jgi:hypothetical protein
MVAVKCMAPLSKNLEWQSISRPISVISMLMHLELLELARFTVMFNESHAWILLEAESPTIHNLEPRKILYRDEEGPHVIHCNVTGQPPPKVEWRKIGNQTTTQTSFLESKTQSLPYLSDGSLLTFPNLTDDVVGEYECKATNMNEKTVSKLIHIELKGSRCVL